MQFASLYNLHFLWLFFALVVFLIWSYRRYRSKMESLIDKKLVDEVVLKHDPSRKVWKITLIAGVFFFSVLALLRPQWGYEWQEVKREGNDIILAIDTSKSMLSADVKPNRLERTKLAVRDLLKRLKGDRIGLVAFAGEAFMVCPMTVDYNGFLMSLNDLDVHTIPRGGTNVDNAIRTALESFDDTKAKFKAIMVITDGDNLEGDPMDAARLAAKEGVKIYTIGIGSPQGDLIQLENRAGETEYLKDPEGNVVLSRLNESLLKDIALATGGAYVKSGGSQFGLDLIYEREIAKLEKREIESKMEKKYHERFQIPLAAAVILFLIQGCMGSVRKQ